MRIYGKIFSVLSLILLVAAPAVRAEQKNVPKFDPANQTTIKGVIEQVNNYECPISGTMGSHLTVRSGPGTVEVHLAASKFLNEYGIAFTKGDTVEVTGTKVVFDGKPALLARQITVGDRTYSFRNDKGLPLW
ncbi:MAG TPA: hypothetical protein VF493_05685 [Terriglobales bacterium]